MDRSSWTLWLKCRPSGPAAPEPEGGWVYRCKPQASDGSVNSTITFGSLGSTCALVGETAKKGRKPALKSQRIRTTAVRLQGSAISHLEFLNSRARGSGGDGRKSVEFASSVVGKAVRRGPAQAFGFLEDLIQSFVDNGLTRIGSPFDQFPQFL